MFENSVAQQQSPPTSRSGQSSAQRPAPAHPNPGSGSADTSYGQQRLKNAINLGKAVGAKVRQHGPTAELSQAGCLISFFPTQVNDLLRRKEPNILGDVGVTEVNKSAGALWSCMDPLNLTGGSR